MDTPYFAAARVRPHFLANAPTDTAIRDVEFNDADVAAAARGDDSLCWSRQRSSQSTVWYLVS